VLTRRGLGLLGAAGLLAGGGALVALSGSSAGSPAPPGGDATASAAAPPAVPPPSTAPPAPTTAAPTPSPSPVEPEVVQAGTGRLRVVPGGSERSGRGPLRTYRVQVEGGLGIDAAGFADQVDATLSDDRSWGADGRMSFRRVADGGADFTVVLASPDTTDRLCLPLDTAGIYSCGTGDTAVINSMRWLEGADAYEDRLPAYRQYVVNHEVGHVLGHGHVPCPGSGEPAPVMLQQTKGVGSCTAQPWPYA